MTALFSRLASGVPRLLAQGMALEGRAWAVHTCWLSSTLCSWACRAAASRMLRSCSRRSLHAEVGPDVHDDCLDGISELLVWKS